MPDDEKQALIDEVNKSTGDMKWVPNVGPQTEAYLSKADLTYYGGAGGGGKTDNALGLAFNEHERTLIMRRKYTDLSGITDRAIEINGTNDGFNGSPPPKLRTSDGRLIEFGAANRVGDEQSFQGRAHDLLAIDEAAQFAESQVRFLMGWVRSVTPGQRCRVVLGSNPPLSDEGAWLVKMFAAWLDNTHPNPAKPGELRWYVTDAGFDYEVPGDGEYIVLDERVIKATLSEVEDEDTNTLTSLSRTFIPARLKDNPYLMRDKQYKAQQDALPPHLRDAIRDGNFNAAREDHELQLIDSEHIQAAMDRWRPQPHNKAPQCAIGVDIAQGGKDQTILAPRYDGWYDKLIKYPGKTTKDGLVVAGHVIKYRRDNSAIIIDMGGGYGGDTYTQLSLNINSELVYKHLGAGGSAQKTATGGLGFANKRAEVYYRFKEALNPSQPGGSKIALPPDPMLFAQLCSIRLKEDDLKTITLEAKKKLVERTGVSPDEADAVVMAWSRGPKQDNFRGGWEGYNKGGAQRPVKTASRSASRFDKIKRKW
jgi:hypothetical protein